MATTGFVWHIKPQASVTVNSNRNGSRFYWPITLRAVSGVYTQGGSFSKNGKSFDRWLPKPNEPLLKTDGTINERWYRFFEEIAEFRLGGIKGPTMTDVQTNVTQAQSAVTQTITAVQTVASAVNANADVLNTNAAVARDAGLPGASQVPAATKVNIRTNEP